MQKMCQKLLRLAVSVVFPTTVSWESCEFPRNCGRKNTKNAETADLGNFQHVFCILQAP